MPESEPQPSASHTSAASLCASSFDVQSDPRCDLAYKDDVQAALPFHDFAYPLFQLDGLWTDCSLVELERLGNACLTPSHDDITWPVVNSNLEQSIGRCESPVSSTTDRSSLDCLSIAPSPSTFSDEGIGGIEAARFTWGESHHDSESSVHNCPQCPESFSRAFELEEHARIFRHKPFSCRQCDQTFSRRDAWTRHRQLHQARGSHPCPHCDKYQGRNAFKRKDHLRTHLLKVHHDTDYPKLCHLSTCKLSSPYGSFKHFERRKDYTKHMREDHGDHT
jgi:hypothetical protein